MAIKITNYHCNNCSNGIVCVKQTTTGSRVKFSFQDCNVCKKEFGLTRIQFLKIVSNEKEVSNDN